MKTLKEYPYEIGRTLYPIDFTLGFLQREDVYVYTGDDPEDQVSYSWVNDGQISLVSPINSGETLKIRRIVLKDGLTNDYELGTRLSENNLDNSFKQALMIIEEIYDGLYLPPTSVIWGNLLIKGNLEVEGTTLLRDMLDLDGNRILNLPYPVFPTDPVRMQDLDGSSPDNASSIKISLLMNEAQDNFGEAVIFGSTYFSNVDFEGLTLSTDDAIVIPVGAKCRKWTLNGANLTFTSSSIQFDQPMFEIDLGGGTIAGGLKIAQVSEESAKDTTELTVYQGHIFVVGDFLNSSLDIYDLPNATDRTGYIANGDYNRITDITDNGDGTDTITLTYLFLNTGTHTVSSGIVKNAWVGNSSFNKNGIVFGAGGNIKVHNGTLTHFQGYVMGVDDGLGDLRKSVLTLENIKLPVTFLDIFRLRCRGLVFDNVYVGRTLDFAKQNIYCDMPQDTGFIVFKNGCHFERQNVDGEIYNRPFDSTVTYPLSEMGNIYIDDTCTFDGTGVTDIVRTSAAPTKTGVLGSFSGSTLTFSAAQQFYITPNQAFDVTGSASNNGRWTVDSVVKAANGWTTSITVRETFTAEVGSTFNIVGALYWGVGVPISSSLHFYVPSGLYTKIGSGYIGASKFKGYERTLFGSTFSSKRWFEQGQWTFNGTTMGCEPIYIGTLNQTKSVTINCSGNVVSIPLLINDFYIEEGQVLEIAAPSANAGSHTVTSIARTGTQISSITVTTALTTESGVACVLSNNSATLSTQDRVQKYVVNTNNCDIKSHGLTNYNGGCYHYDVGSKITLTDENKDSPLLNGSTNFSFVHKTGGSLNGRYLINTMETTLKDVRIPYTDNVNNLVLFRDGIISNPNETQVILMPPLDDKFNGTETSLNNFFGALPVTSKWFSSNVSVITPAPPGVNFRVFGCSQTYQFGGEGGFTTPYTKTSLLPRNMDAPFQTIGKHSGVYTRGDRFYNTQSKKQWYVNKCELFTALTTGIASTTNTVQLSSAPVGTNWTWCAIWSSTFGIMHYKKVLSVVGDLVTFTDNSAYAWAIADSVSLISASPDVDNRDTPNKQLGTSYSLKSTDVNRTVKMYNAGANTVAIGNDAFQFMAPHSVIMVMQNGAGTTTIDADPTVTLNGVLGGSCTISARWMGATLVKDDVADTWEVTGAISEVA